MIRDINCETEIKQKLNKLYSDLLDNKIYRGKYTLPGLMFNLDQICKKNKNFPKKFKYQQNHIYIVSNLYRIKPFNIPQNDKLLICDLIVDFNKYIKNRKKASSIKKSNAVLWNVSLKCVFMLPYFRCYKDIIEILPDKIEATTNTIMETWTLFKIVRPDLFNKYTTMKRDEVATTNDVQTNSEITKADPNDINDVMNFINKTGGNYGEGLTDTYLKSKNGVADVKTEWKDDFVLK
jgi:hypothetical protein